MNKVIYPELSYKLIGILFAVHNEIGRFYNEKQYCDAIEKYLQLFKITHEREKILPISFENEFKGRNRIDFLIDNKIVLEIKTKKMLTREDYYQTKRYLTALNKKLAILVNFHQRYLTPKRILNSGVSD